MAYRKYTEESSNNTIIQDDSPEILSTDNNNYSSETFDFYEIEPGEVLDIILDEDHPDFISFEDIGKAKVRLLYSHKNLGINDINELNLWAKPLNPNKKDYPLKHEVVLTAYYVTRENVEDNNTTNELSKSLYYTDRLNSLTSPHCNPMLNVSLTTEKKEEKLELGSKFEYNENIRPLKQFEGDITYEGRSGQSIRFGHNEDITQPNIKIRVGQDTENLPEITTKPIIENINLDGSSIYLTIDEIVELEKGSDKNSAFDNFPSTLNDKQIILNSDRIILNCKNNQLIGMSNDGIHWATEGDYVVGAKGKAILDTPEIYLGYEAKENVVLGKQLKNILEELINEIVKITCATPSGPSSTPNNSNKFLTIKNKLNKILSKRNYTL